MIFEDYEAESRAAGEDVSPPSKTKPILYMLTIDCVSGPSLREKCQRVIEMKSNSTLYDLHAAIQQAVNFDDDHCFEFFIGRNLRSRKIVFSEDDDAVFDEIQLWRIWPLPKGMHLFYWFDFGDDWKFRIKKSRSSKDPEKGARYPRPISKVGPNPTQYPDHDAQP